MPEKSKDLKSKKVVKKFHDRVEVTNKPVMFIRRPVIKKK